MLSHKASAACPQGLSMPRTILSELARQNPDVDNSCTKSGANTFATGWPMVDSWTVWQDFNARQLYNLYKDIVDAEWRDPPAVTETTRFDRRIFDEDSLEHNILSKTLLPLVNAALRHARRVLGLDRSFDLDLGRAGRCYYNPSGDGRFSPDWSLCSEKRVASAVAYENLLPGDTKLSRKWHSTYYIDDTAQWRDPMRQVLHYCDKSGVRYGFILTELELAVFRYTREAIGPGIGGGGGGQRPRGQQQLPTGSYRVVSGSSDTSKLSDALQNTSLSSNSYQPTDSGGEYLSVEYRVIPWTNHGDGKRHLTVRLALFYLSMMAGLGPSAIQTEYPSFDSWFCLDNGGFMHNTTGRIEKKLPPNAVVQYLDPATSRPEWVTLEGVQYLTRASVRTLGVDRNQYYYVDEGNNRVYVTKDVDVYDRESEQLGCFDGLAWMGPDEVEKSNKNKKRRKK
ncbi:hypothetical protein B0T17DRAFT_527065 [Bombardia bombarda]|uniref:Uncharacterized protein n=1 Tax=Bombardia bombarda TaxID=252184 RepID=A0AA39X9R0_9PEZI|nr:hypothetical protein B0T17DRAFT_527065 [Bombardia bombarda]